MRIQPGRSASARVECQGAVASGNVGAARGHCVKINYGTAKRPSSDLRVWTANNAAQQSHALLQHRRCAANKLHRSRTGHRLLQQGLVDHRELALIGKHRACNDAGCHGQDAGSDGCVRDRHHRHIRARAVDNAINELHRLHNRWQRPNHMAG